MFDENGMLKSRYLEEQKKEVGSGKNRGYTLCNVCGKKYSLKPTGCNNPAHMEYYVNHKA